ncbi:MAG: CatB-related O-acetyltransferase [Acutalibacteraceae bacterium]|nr:CatB-related O-acetyltransferase [Acutalibacteraceae bacterium]
MFVSETASVQKVQGAVSAKIYNNCRVVDTTLADNATIGDNSRVFNSSLGNEVHIQREAMMYSTVVGDYTYTGRNFTAWHSKIGKFCSISWNVSIGGANHDYERVTTHAFLYSNDYDFLNGRTGYNRFEDECVIGNDVWIAANACICRGVVIGDGAVIGAGAVVTKNVEPYTIVAGVPAKPIKKRFSNDIINILLESQWWNLPSQVIRDNFELFNSKPDINIAKEILALKKKLEGDNKC